jgi:hypothetical protein
MLEDVEAGSLKIWLSNVFSAIDDDAIKTLDWRKILGEFLLRSKYVYIEWANQKEPEKSSLAALADGIGRIASATDVRHFPAYAPPSVADLADATNDIDEAKSFLREGDSISYQVPGESPIHFDLSVAHSPETLIELSVKERVLFPAAPMRLIVRKPDYLGNAKWEFRHGRRSIPMKIEDAEWLHKFQSRGVDVRPGDALHCQVVIENSYGYDNELVRETFTIVKVINVIEKNAQIELLDPS